MAAAASEKSEPTSTNNNEGGAMECDIESSFNNAVEEAVNTLLALTKQENNEEQPTPDEPSITEAAKKAEEAEKKQQDIERVRKGWSSEDCGTVSIGELYLMVLLLYAIKNNLFTVFYLYTLLVWLRWEIGFGIQLG